MPTPQGWGYSDIAGVCDMCKGAGTLTKSSPVAEWHAHLDLQVRSGQMAKDTATTYRQGMRKLTEWASQQERMNIAEKMIYHQDTQLTIHNGDALAVLRTMAAESVQMCVTSPPYYTMPPYYGIMRIWQANQKQTADSNRVSGEALQPNLRKANTGDHADRIGIRNGLLLSTPKSNGQQVILRLKLDVPTLPLSSGLGSTRYRAEVPVRRGLSSIGERKVKQTRCTASAEARITTGKAAVRQSDSLSTRQKSGQRHVLLSGSATRLNVNGAAHIRAQPDRCTFTTSFLLR